MNPVWSFELTGDAIRARMTALGITSTDRRLLRVALPRVEAGWPEYLDTFYSRLLEHPEATPLLQVPGIVQHLKSVQENYLRSLFSWELDIPHAKELVRIGNSHYRHRVTPQLYLASYAALLVWHVEALLERDLDVVRGRDTFLALVRCVFYDMNLVLDAYGAGEIRDLLTRRSNQVSPSDAAPPYSASTQGAHPPSARRLSLTNDEVQVRRALLDISAADLATLRAMAPRLGEIMPVVTERFYGFAAEHPELGPMVAGHTAQRLKGLLATYWQELCAADLNRAYAASRLRVGLVHERSGMSLQWYLSGLARQMVDIISPHPGWSFDPVQIRSLIKAVFFDLTFVIDAYMNARADALLHTEGIAKDLIAGLPAGIAVIDRHYRVIAANPALVDLLPGGAALLYRMPIRYALPMPELDTLLQRLTDGGAERAVVIGRFGSRQLKVSGVRMTGKSTKPGEEFALVIDDVTDLMLMSEGATGGSHRLNLLSESLHAVLWELEGQNKSLVYVSAHVFALTGHRDVYFIGRPNAWFDLIAPHDRVKVLRRLSRLHEGQSTSVEYRIHRLAGEERWVRSTVTRAKDPEGFACWKGVTVDITEDKRGEATQWRAVRMVAGGIAHVLNNSLMAITGRLHLFLSRSTPPQQLPQLSAALDEIAGAKAVTAQLLAYSGQQPLRPVQGEIVQVLREISDSVLEDHGESINVELSVDENLWPIHIDTTEFKVALWALVDNALEAMPDGGVLQISAQNLPDGSSSGGAPVEGDWVEVRISDTGAGIAAEHLPNAVNPFFTTKSPELNHHGLGLSAAYGFTHQSGGRFLLESAVGKGTTARMSFPKFTPASGIARPTPGVKPAVLLVEDHAGVRDAIALFLTQSGLSVAATGSAAEALHLLTMRSFDVLLTDIDLGAGIDGVELARRATHDNPLLSVVLISGYAANHFDLSKIPEGWQFLQKPFNPDQLTSLIRSLLAHLQGPAETSRVVDETLH